MSTTTNTPELSHAGWLFKRGSLGRWQRRWAVVKGQFAYFHKERDETQNKEKRVNLKECVVTSDPSTFGENSDAFVFHVCTRPGYNPKNRYDLKASSEADRNRWVRVFNAASLGQQTLDKPEGPRSKGFERMNRRSVAGSAMTNQSVLARLSLASASTEKAPVDLIQLVYNSVIGNHTALEGPFGTRRIVYADYTASGRCLDFVERIMSDLVYPMYANTHTEVSATGMQTTHFREEARLMIMESCNADPKKDCLIFCGSGSTGCIAKLIDCLGIRIPSMLQDKYDLLQYIPQDDRPVIFVGPYEHHSNEVMWRETIAEVVVIGEKDGDVDMEFLEEQLKKYTGRTMIGSFSAGSNVTGILTDVDAISTLLHQYGALAFFDYAGAGPYVHIDMNPIDNPKGYMDACFVSPHKFAGGPGTPGILLGKRSLFKNRVPAIPGGGTVAFVDLKNQWYEEEIESREEGGTPGIPQAIRCGLVFHLKRLIGDARIEKIENDYARRAIEQWSKHPNLVLVGSDRKAYHSFPRLSIISFLVRYTVNDKDQYLHHHFVVKILNDIFGIQARSGCSCAGPYGHRLFNVTDDFSRTMREAAMDGGHATKLGWSRVNFNYFIPEEEFQFIVRAVELVATHGYKLLPLYRLDVRSGQYYHWNFDPLKNVRLLSEALTTQGVKNARWPKRPYPSPDECINLATNLFEQSLPAALRGGLHISNYTSLELSEKMKQVRFFPLAEEVVGDMKIDVEKYTEEASRSKPVRPVSQRMSIRVNDESLFRDFGESHTQPLFEVLDPKDSGMILHLESASSDDIPRSEALLNVRRASVYQNMRSRG